MSPSLTVIWGTYFKPDPAEQQQVVALVQAALGGGTGGGERLITKRVGVQKLAAVFDIENVAAALEEIEKEEAERSDAELEKSTAELHAIASANAGAVGKPGGAKPPGAPDGGSRGAGSAQAHKKPSGAQ